MGMDIFWRLLLAHFLADFTFQTDRLVILKRENIWGVLFHTLIFLVCGVILCWTILTRVWLSVGGVPLHGVTIVLALAAFHFCVDWFLVWSINQGMFSDSIYYFLADQAMHFLPLLLFFDRGALTDIGPDRWYVLGILFVLVTHFMTIFIYYIKKDFFHPERIDQEKKYIFIADRLVVWLAFFITGIWWMALVALWISRTIWLRIRRQIEYSWVEILIGYACVLVLGYLARVIYFS